MTAKTNQNNVLQILKWVISLGVPLLIFLLVPTTEVVTLQMKGFMAITLWAILVWVMDLIQVYIAGILLNLFYILFGIAGADVVFSPWTGSIIWLILGGLIIAVVFDKSGLMKRMAYFCIRKTGGSYKGIVIGMAVAGIIAALLVPNITGRVTIFCAISFGICKAMDLKPGTKTGIGIMFAGFNAGIGPRWVWMSGDDNIMIIAQHLKNAGIEVTWMQHLISNALPALLWLVVSTGLILILFKQDVQFSSKDHLEKEAKSLGTMQLREKKMLVIIALVLLGMLFTKIDPGWLFMLGAAACFLPGIHISPIEDLQATNFPIIIFTASCMAIGSVSNAVGFSSMIGDMTLPLLGGANNFGMILVAYAFGVIFNMFMTPMAATAALVPSIIEIAGKLGLSAVGASYGFVWGVQQLFFPYEWVLFLILFSYGMFDNKTTLKWGSIRFVLATVFLCIIIIPFWMLTGFLKI
ncbi:SLC13 family permease [Diplocloster hominis]|uniref:SLC13 family permease n=1 Tax=Diplocloster hominis TaxID=3079010 RepID=UPI0031BB4550